MSHISNNNHSSAAQSVGFLRSIQGQLILWFLFLGLVPLVAMGVISYIQSQSALHEAAQSKLEAVSEAKAVRVAAWMADTGRIAQVIAELPSIKGDNDDDNYIGLEEIARYRNDPANRDRYQTAYENAHNTITSFTTIYSRVDAVILTSADGSVMVSNLDAVPEGTPIRQVPTIDFEGGLKGLVFSDVQLSVDGENLILVVTTPVVNARNQTVGTASVRITLDRLEEIMTDRTGLGETGETYLVNYNTKLMVTRSMTVDNTVLNQTVDTFAIQQVLAGVGSGDGDYRDYRDVPVVGAWSLVSGTEWVVVAEVDQHEAYDAVFALRDLLLALGVGTGIIITIVAYLIARTISQPIIDVSTAAGRIAEGDLDERVRLESRNEIGLLAQSFNTMTDNLQQMMEAERESKAYLETTVSEYMAFVASVAKGNLKNRLQTNNKRHTGDETEDDLVQLGKNLNTMVESLADIARQVREVASTVSSSATEIQAATTQQTASAAEQDASVTETVATLEEVRQTVLQTAERAQTVANASQQSMEVSREGQTAVVDTMEGMQLIRQRVESIAETILALSERTQQIGEIINTVNAVADQSKLLALNASIEAARAGEEGKGFAVVAMEVRQLAEQSREATARVRDILSEIQSATNTAVMVTEEGSKGAETGMTLVNRAGEAIRNLAATIEQAAQSATQIAASTHQQTNGVDQLATAMSQIKQASAQTAASTRQAEQSVRDLVEMARKLNQAAAQYDL